ncbi:MFS transporter [Propionibacteriaceae bacterium G57]|uniref:MFS transporter n=1 Tax=Aestuariimicrobium sp. G57 TaxID=3418485 RepID=UPI003DA77A59
MTLPATDQPATTQAPRPRSLFSHHDFRQLWLGDTVSVFGMQFVMFAMPLMAVRLLSANEFQMGVLTALETLAFLLIGLPAGAWVDRWRKKRVIVIGDLGRAALLLTLPAAWLLGVLSLPQLYVVAFLVGCITVFFDVANQSYLPEIVEGSQISEGNSKLQASQQVAQVIGPAAASGLVRLLGSPLTIAVTSVCMAASSLFVSRIRHVEQAPHPAGRRPLVAEIREGLAFVVRQPLLRRIVAATGIVNLGSSATQALFVIYAIKTLGLDETLLGLVFSVAAVGGILGAVTAGPFAARVGEGRAIPLSMLAMGLAGFATPLASYLSPVPTLVIGWFVTSWGVVVYNVTQVSFRQRLCPKPLLGRMNASIRFLVWGPMPIGAFVGGLVGRHLGVLEALWIFAGVALASALPVLISPLVRMRDLPGPQSSVQESSVQSNG